MRSGGFVSAGFVSALAPAAGLADVAALAFTAGAAAGVGLTAGLAVSVGLAATVGFAAAAGLSPAAAAEAALPSGFGFAAIAPTFGFGAAAGFGCAPAGGAIAPLLPLLSGRMSFGSVAVKARAAAGTCPALAARDSGFGLAAAAFAGPSSSWAARAVGCVRPVQTRIG
ncbi:MAG TPA: hypothetical protein VEY05_06225 [Beijerinckiaceae bacterium]|nr:hypothetical protein [Beijerinckiaceae bacterium]